MVDALVRELRHTLRRLLARPSYSRVAMLAGLALTRALAGVDADGAVAGSALPAAATLAAAFIACALPALKVLHVDPEGVARVSELSIVGLRD
jgi:hypothetical protein